MKTGDLLRPANSTFRARDRSGVWWITLPSDIFFFFVLLGEMIDEDIMTYYVLLPKGTVLRVVGEDLVLL
jgi:hypothetical protein